MRKLYLIFYFDNIYHPNELHFFHLCFKDVTMSWRPSWFFHLNFVGVPSWSLWNNCKLNLLECVLCLKGCIWGVLILEGNVLNVHWFSQCLHGEKITFIFFVGVEESFRIFDPFLFLLTWARISNLDLRWFFCLFTFLDLFLSCNGAFKV